MREITHLLVQGVFGYHIFPNPVTNNVVFGSVPLFVICSYWVQKWQKMAENLENARLQTERKRRCIK